MQKHEEQLNKQKIKQINIVSFFLGFSQAILVYIFSSYLESIVGSSNISAYYFISYSITLIVILNLHKIVNFFGKSKIFFYSLFVKILSLLLITIMPPNWFSVLILTIFIICATINFLTIDIILESYSIDNKSGEIRGLHLILFDTGFLFGPLLSMAIISKYNFQAAFLISVIIEILVMIYALKRLNGNDNKNKKFNHNISVKEIIEKVLYKKDILKIYYISFILEFFYSIMIIFTPIYLRNNGLNWNQIGIIFTIMLIPFVILPYPIGKLADKKFGEKEMIFVSLFFMAISTWLIYYIKTDSLVTWSIVLFMTRIGASALQTLRDSYFYKKIDGHDVDLINFFRTTGPASYIIAATLSFFILKSFPVIFIFPILSIIIATGLFPALTMKDNKSVEEIIIEKNLKLSTFKK